MIDLVADEIADEANEKGTRCLDANLRLPVLGGETLGLKGIDKGSRSGSSTPRCNDGG